MKSFCFQTLTSALLTHFSTGNVQVEFLGVDIDPVLIKRCMDLNMHPGNITFNACNIMNAQDRQCVVSKFWANGMLLVLIWSSFFLSRCGSISITGTMVWKNSSDTCVPPRGTSSSNRRSGNATDRPYGGWRGLTVTDLNVLIRWSGEKMWIKTYVTISPVTPAPCVSCDISVKRNGNVHCSCLNPLQQAQLNRSDLTWIESGNNLSCRCW